jgi:hypothetical protein
MRRARRVSASGVSAVGTRPAYEARRGTYDQEVRHNRSDYRERTVSTMIGFAMLLFPFLMLGFMLLMQRVEEPLSQVAEERDIEHFLDDANPEELDTFVREGTESALTRFRQRLGLGRLRRVVARERTDSST